LFLFFRFPHHNPVCVRLHPHTTFHLILEHLITISINVLTVELGYNVMKRTEYFESL
jgi:hypothetical protein